jgi:hypothetical protein
VIGNSEANQRGAANADEHTVTVDGIADRTQQTVVQRINAKDLRVVTPEELQLLAATGC